MRILLLLSTIIFLITVPVAIASATKDNVGTKIPKLSVDFVANQPRSTVGRPMIVEFWATWCGPCVKNIPHLNQLHQKFSSKGLVIIGVTKEEPRKVRDFIKTHPMHYAVAINRSGSLSKHFGVKGIPHALLVNAAGRVVWEGHPSNLKDADIQRVLVSGPAPVRKLPKVL